MASNPQDLLSSWFHTAAQLTETAMRTAAQVQLRSLDRWMETMTGVPQADMQQAEEPTRKGRKNDARKNQPSPLKRTSQAISSSTQSSANSRTGAQAQKAAKSAKPAKPKAKQKSSRNK